MCGFSGIVNFHSELSDRQIKQLTHSIENIAHRGPDYQGELLFPKVGLAHARLSILDLDERSHQPFQLEGLPYTLVFNGEIYNFQILRRELEQKGIQFRTTSDTEVVYYGLIEYGIEFLSRLNGMFALAWYTHGDESILLARDSVGIKPLLYGHSKEKGELIFSSELVGLVPFLPHPTISATGLEAYLTLSYTPAPYTIFEEVKKLLPGRWIQYQSNQVVAEGEICAPLVHDASDVAEVLDVAVEQQLIADVPVGAFLSGGLDSSILTYLASQKKTDLQAFSIGFPDAPFMDESEIAARTAQELGVQHHILELSDSDFLGIANTAVDKMPEPFGDSSAIPFYAISEYAKGHVQVVLSGDGADELFGGYQKHQAIQRFQTLRKVKTVAPLARQILKFLPTSREGKLSNNVRKIQKALEASQYDFKELLWYLASWQQPRNLQLLSEEALAKSSFLDFQMLFSDQLQHEDMHTALEFDQKMVLPNDMLLKSDSMSMATGLEVRVPFLSPGVMHKANSLGSDQFIANGVGKIALREAFQQKLPNHLFQQPKRGFEVPLQAWMRNGFMSYEIDNCHDMLSELLDKSNFLTILHSNGELNKGSYYTRYYFNVLNVWLHKYYS